MSNLTNKTNLFDLCETKISISSKHSRLRRCLWANGEKRDLKR